MSTPPYEAPGSESPVAKEDPARERVEHPWIEGAEQQVGAGESVEPSALAAHEPPMSGGGQAQGPEGRQETTERIIIGAEQQAGAGEQAASPEADAYDRRAAKDAELDEALDDSFPASDPPSQTTKGRVK